MGALALYPGSLSHREPADEASGCSCMHNYYSDRPVHGCTYIDLD